MIYYTAWHKPEDVAELYQEWTSKQAKFETPLLNSYLVVACDGEKFVGAVQLLLFDDPFWNRRWGLIENVYVKRGYRNQGIGKELMKHMEVEAALMGCKFIKLTSAFNKKAGRLLYQSLNYEEGFSFKKEL